MYNISNSFSIFLFTIIISLYYLNLKIYNFTFISYCIELYKINITLRISKFSDIIKLDKVKLNGARKMKMLNKYMKLSNLSKSYLKVINKNPRILYGVGISTSILFGAIGSYHVYFKQDISHPEKSTEIIENKQEKQLVYYVFKYKRYIHKITLSGANYINVLYKGRKNIETFYY